MKYKPADNMTSDFPETYEIFIGLSQCCDNTNCWYYGGPGLRHMFQIEANSVIGLEKPEFWKPEINRLGTLKSETIETASSRKYLNISIMLLRKCISSLSYWKSHKMISTLTLEKILTYKSDVTILL